MAEEIQEETPLPAPGVKLKMRREALNLSIEEIAEKLHLRPSVVTELESDVIDHNISMTFTRGYISLYARHLELDPAPLLAEFDELANPVRQPAKLQSFSQKVAKQASDARLMMFTWFVLFVIVAMAVVWWFQQPETSGTAATAVTAQGQQIAVDAPPADEPVVAPDSAPVAVNDNVQTPQQPIETFAQSELIAANGSEIAESPVLENGAEAASEVSADEGDIASTAVVDSAESTGEQSFLSESADNEEISESGEIIESEFSAPAETDATESAELQTLTADLSISEIAEASAPGATEEVQTVLPSETATQFATAESVELIFTFSEDCWMNLTDATGEAIAYGIKAAGRVMPVSGVPPFEVKLGAPQAVSLTVDGVPFDMSEFPAGRTATFTIGAE